MIRNLNDMPEVGTWVYDNDNPAMELERLQCVAHLNDGETSDIKYALFAHENSAMNTHEEFGIRFYKMHGYSKLDYEEENYNYGYSNR